MTKKYASDKCGKSKGIIYVIGSEDHSTPYKIGFTGNKDVSKRLAGIQMYSWVTLKVLFQSPIVNNVMQVERRIHFRYANRRVRNEWFALTKKDLAKLKKQFNEGEFNDEAEAIRFDKLAAKHAAERHARLNEPVDYTTLEGMLRAIQNKEMLDFEKRSGIR